MIVQCCVCEKVREDGHWFVLANPVDPHTTAVSHGYCPICADEAFGELYRRSNARREAAHMEVVHAA